MWPKPGPEPLQGVRESPVHWSSGCSTGMLARAAESRGGVPLSVKLEASKLAQLAQELATWLV